MSRSTKTFVKVDEDIFQDDKIRNLLEKGGFAAFGHYIGLLTVFRRYEEYHFRIPFDQIAKVAEWDLHCRKTELDKTIQLCLSIGLFEDDTEMFWSVRRSKDLSEQLAKLQARKENAAKTNAKRKAQKDSVGVFLDALEKKAKVEL